MTQTPDNGGPAFPEVAWKYDQDRGRFVESISGGMTLRDWFAGQILASCARHWIIESRASDVEVAQWAYETADAMIAARKGVAE
jgi:hypothetical protein